MLIKRISMMRLLKEAGISRISSGAIKCIDKKIEENLKKMAPILKEEAIIRGRKTIKKEDVENIFKEKENYNFEV